VQNTGDTGLPECNLQLAPWSSSQDNWSYNFIPSCPFAVSPGYTKTVLLIIYPAPGAEAKRWTFNLKGTTGISSNQISINLDIKQYGGVEIRAPQQKQAMPGDTLEFDFEIVNTGNGKDRFYITSVETGVPTIVPYLKDQNNWTGDIASQKTAVKTVVVIVPYDMKTSEGTEGYKLTLKAMSSICQTSDDSNWTLILVTHIYDISLGISPPNATLLPGDQAEFNVTVLNLGNGRDNITLNLTASFDLTNWTVSLGRSWFNLSAVRQNTTKLKVTPPMNAVSGSNYKLELTARSSGPPYPDLPVERSEPLAISVLPVYRFFLPQQNITAEAPVPPGGSLHLPFNITNAGNADDTVDLWISVLPEKWNATLGPPSAISIRRGATEQATLNIQPSDDVAFSRAGDHVVQVRISSSDGAFTGIMTFHVTVSPVYDCSVAVNGPSFAEVNLFETNRKTFFLEVVNTGNTADNLSLTFGGPNASWGRLDTPLVPLALGERRMVPVVMEAPPVEGLEGGTYALSVNVTSVNRPELTVQTTFTVKLRRFDPSDTRPVLQVYPARQSLLIGQGATTELNISVQCRRDDVANVTIRFILSPGLLLDVEALTPSGDLGPGDNRSWILRISAPEAGKDIEGYISVRAAGDNQTAQWVQIPVRIKAAVHPGATVSMGAIGLALAVFLALGGIAVGWNEVVMLALITQLLPLYSKIRREEVLDQYTRGKIHGYIIANPGEHYNSLKAQLKLKNGTLAYHLRVLEREGYVKSARDGPFKRFYPQEAAVPKRRSEFSSIQEIVLENVRVSPGITQNDVAVRMGVSSQVVNYHIRNLVRAGRIRLQREGRTTRCYLK
jgi:predicted transcriptional regulator